MKWLLVVVAAVGVVLLVLRYGAWQREIGAQAFRREVHEAKLVEWAQRSDSLGEVARTAEHAAAALGERLAAHRQTLDRLRVRNRALLDSLNIKVDDTSGLVRAVVALREEADVCGSALALCVARGDSLAAALAVLWRATEGERALHDSTARLWRAAEDRTARLLAARRAKPWEAVLLIAGCGIAGYGLADEKEMLALAGVVGCGAGLAFAIF